MTKLDTAPPPQHQNQQPGRQKPMYPQPLSIVENYRGAAKLKDKVAIISGGDSGIGRAIAYHYAKEEADVALIYLNEDEDAKETKEFVEKNNRQCVLFKGDVGEKDFCMDVCEKLNKQFGKIDILINNAAEQHTSSQPQDISQAQLERTFRTNVFAYFYMVQAAMPYLGKGCVIINTTSVTAYRGSKRLLDYAATRGAIVAFTRSLALMLAEEDIRVNGVAPGPIWTPLIPASFSAEEVGQFGAKTPMGRPGQPAEVAPCYVFLASEDASYMTGQVLHPNGGEIVNG